MALINYCLHIFCSFDKQPTINMIFSYHKSKLLMRTYCQNKGSRAALNVNNELLSELMQCIRCFPSVNPWGPRDSCLIQHKGGAEETFSNGQNIQCDRMTENIQTIICLCCNIISNRFRHVIFRWEYYLGLKAIFKPETGIKAAYPSLHKLND